MANERARQLRRERTTAERRLWWKLRALKQAGFKFRQQVPIDHFIVDFACLSNRVIIEVDGGTHGTDEEIASDATRQRYLEMQGFRVLRFWNSEVKENIEGVMDTIVGALGPPPPSPPRVVSKTRLRHDGEGSRAQHASLSDQHAASAANPTLPLAGRVARSAGWGNFNAATHPEPPILDPSPQEGGDAEMDRVLAVAAAVVDPEIPVLTLEDLGVLRGVERRDGRIVVRLTPTYTGCPATLAIQLAVEAALAEAGLAEARVETILSPPWSTDQITEEGRHKLREFGIAPPNRASGPRALFGEETVACPKCGSVATTKVSEFGSTACKALWRCESCAEPFDYFKCL